MKKALIFAKTVVMACWIFVIAALVTACTTRGRVASSTQAQENFVRINGGTFTMGSTANEQGRFTNENQQRQGTTSSLYAFDNEGPQRNVTVSSFYMGKNLVTVEEYRRFVNASGYITEAERGNGGAVITDGQWGMKDDANWKNPYMNQEDNHPVLFVSWYDAVWYCNWLSQQEGLTPAYTINGTDVTWNRNTNGYRLPTEAEWEYACRAGTTTAYSTGDSITTSQANFDGQRQGTTPVGSFEPNPWGLFDMHGNVVEWCWDWYEEYPSEAQTDPIGASFGSGRVIRGGSWHTTPALVRSAFRTSFFPSGGSFSIGFRLARF